MHKNQMTQHVIMHLTKQHYHQGINTEFI